MTSSNENILSVTGPLCGEFTGHWWIPLTQASDAELWCFLWSAPEQRVEKNNLITGDLRRHRANYDVIVMHACAHFCYKMLHCWVFRLMHCGISEMGLYHGYWCLIPCVQPSSHYYDVIMSLMVSQITSLTIVYSTVYSVTDQRKHQSSASLAFVRGIHRWIPRTKGQ